MTKTELQVALADATQTSKKTAGAMLNALGAIAYKAIKKDGEFVLPGLGKLVKQKRPARMAFNPQTRQKVKVAAKTVVKFRHREGGQGCDPRGQGALGRKANGKASAAAGRPDAGQSSRLAARFN